MPLPPVEDLVKKMTVTAAPKIAVGGSAMKMATLDVDGGASIGVMPNHGAVGRAPVIGEEPHSGGHRMTLAIAAKLGTSGAMRLGETTGGTVIPGPTARRREAPEAEKIVAELIQVPLEKQRPEAGLCRRALYAKITGLYCLGSYIYNRGHWEPNRQRVRREGRPRQGALRAHDCA